MIKSIDTVLGLLKELSLDSSKRMVLEEWGNSIIDHCRDNWECHLEQRDVEDEVECYTLENGDQVYPVLSRGSIERIKELIK